MATSSAPTPRTRNMGPLWTWETIQPKSWPKKPVMKVSVRQIPSCPPIFPMQVTVFVGVEEDVMAKSPFQILLSAEERAELERRVACYTLPHKVVQRAKMIP